MESYLGYNSWMSICAIVVLPVLLWWLSIKTNRRVRWFGYYLILFFIQGSIELTGLVNNTLLRYLFELPFLFMYITSYKKYSYAGRSLILPFIIISTISAFETSLIMLVLFLLYFLEVFMLLIYFRNNYQGVDAEVLHKLLWFLACSQIFAAIIKFFMVGVMEPYIGSMSSHEGGITTVFSLVMYCYALEMYFCTKKRRYLLALLGFVFFGISGQKRALAFFFPLFFFVVFLLHSRFTNSTINNIKKIVYGVVFMPFLFVILCILNPSFNPEGKVGGSFDLAYVLDYSNKYENGEFSGDDNVGRTSAAFVLHEKLLKAGLFNQLFGYGSGIIIPSSFNSQDTSYDAKIKKFGVGYSLGIGYTTLLVQVGFVGVLLYFLIFFALLTDIYRKTKFFSPKMSSMELGLCVSAILTLVCIIFLSIIYNNTSFYFNCASLINMWIIAYAYITLSNVKKRIVCKLQK